MRRFPVNRFRQNSTNSYDPSLTEVTCDDGCCSSQRLLMGVPIKLTKKSGFSRFSGCLAIDGISLFDRALSSSSISSMEVFFATDENQGISSNQTERLSTADMSLGTFDGTDTRLALIWDLICVKHLDFLSSKINVFPMRTTTIAKDGRFHLERQPKQP